ncbi:MAG TPA: hypothetical protein VLD16_09200 [Gaiellaceae bacterium]|nr:hypothetical protein [Gaiellaceae bacterium]
MMLGLAAALVVLGLTGGNVALAVPKAPVPSAPAAGAVVDHVPAFAWSAVAGAEEYEYEIAADAGFNSPVLGAGKDDFHTKNLRATLQQTVPNGTYWWRVRALGRSGGASAWSRPRSFVKRWGLSTQLLSPAAGASIVYPYTPLELSWAPVAGARTYLVSLATDPGLGSLVKVNGSAKPVETSATTLTPAAALAPGAYYWSVTPLDAEGNRGAPSAVRSFVWSWPSSTTTHLDDLNPAPEAYDPRFSWDPVAGAARYEVEINPTSEFAPGSRVCCSDTTTATSLSPTQVLKDNVYYWRVRAFDADGDAGVWNDGGSFTKTFDKVAPAGPVTGTSIKNLRLRDNLSDPGTDLDSGTAGYQTRVPVVRWDPVPGAASYEIQVAGWTGSACAWAVTPAYIKKSSVPEWSPLANTNSNPVNWQGTLAEDTLPIITPGTWCFRVRARSDRAVGNQEVWGDYTYLQDGNVDSTGPAGPAFTWVDYPSSADPSNAVTCSFGYPCSSSYLEPVTGSTSDRTPLFTWPAQSGVNSYFVVVAKDANFSNTIDEAFTRVPAYAPRNLTVPTTYPDETTTFYWAVLPAASADGHDALPLDLPNSAKGSFQKQSTAPTLLSPSAGQVFSDQPSFRWTPALGARRYRLQVAADPTFGSPLDDVVTDATSYSSDTTYPADTILYWRVRADDENLLGLTWSATGTFRKTLPAPAGLPGNTTQGDAIPTWSWNVVPGAVSYDVSVDLPDGTHKDLSGFRTPAMTPVQMYGTGIFHWRVRAEFARTTSGTTPGRYSGTYAFTRTIREPSNPRADVARDHILLGWDAKAGARRYRVQISDTPTFAKLVDNVVTDNTSYAPLLTWRGQRTLNTGRLYWRVAATDEGDNVGDFTQPQLISRIRRMELGLRGALKRGSKRSLTVTVSDFESGGGVGGATLRVRGAGIRRTTRTSAYGSVRLMLRPTRRGYLSITASKRGFTPTSVRLRIR